MRSSSEKKDLLSKKECEFLVKILERFSNAEVDLDDIREMLRGHIYKMQIDTLYDQVFRPHLKYESPLCGKSLTEVERDAVAMIWNKVYEHFK